MSKKHILVACLAVSMLGACRGRNASPIQVAQDRDINMTCSQIHHEMHAIQNHVNKLHQERASSNAGNAAAVVGSIIFLPAIAFLDLSKAEQVEIEAYRSRYEHLNELLHSKHCEVVGIKEPSSTTKRLK